MAGNNAEQSSELEPKRWCSWSQNQNSELKDAPRLQHVSPGSVHGADQGKGFVIYPDSREWTCLYGTLTSEEELTFSDACPVNNQDI